MKKIATLFFTFLLGLGIGGFAVYHYFSEFLRYSLYMDAAGSITAYSAVLRAQKAGNHAQATEWLERFMSTEVIILERCKIDLCQSRDMPAVEKSLALARNYQYTQYSPVQVGEDPASSGRP